MSVETTRVHNGIVQPNANANASANLTTRAR